MSCPFLHGPASSSTFASPPPLDRIPSPEISQRVLSATHLFRASLGSEMTHPLKAWLKTKKEGDKENSTVNDDEGERYSEEITYWNYIHPDILTSLQTGRQGKGLNHHDEHLFIVVHQVYELWLKQILWELDFVRSYFLNSNNKEKEEHQESNKATSDLALAVKRLKRATFILKQITTTNNSIMETMDPADFLEFRDFLSPSSGFQSVQFRLLEIFLGLKQDERFLCNNRHYKEAFLVTKPKEESKESPKEGANIRKESPREQEVDDSNYVLLEKMEKQEVPLVDALLRWLQRLSSKPTKVEEKEGNSAPLPELDSFLHAFFQVKKNTSSSKVEEIQQQISLLEALLSKTKEANEQQYLSTLLNKAKQEQKQQFVLEVHDFFDENKEDKARARAAALLFLTFPHHPRYYLIASLLNTCLEFEEATLLWRQSHGRMVELFLGRKPGTGGSSGVGYIENTVLHYRVFKDLWRLRSLQISGSFLLEQQELLNDEEDEEEHQKFSLPNHDELIWFDGEVLI